MQIVSEIEQAKKLAKLEVDAFVIDTETLHDATRGNMRSDFASKYVAEQVIKNLTQESKKRFGEYQEKENPCKGEQ